MSIKECLQGVVFMGILLLSCVDSYAYTEKDVHCLSSTIYKEARGEPLLGQLAVASVVLNRASMWGMNVCDVVFQPKQFSWLNNNKNLPSKASVAQFNYISHTLLTQQHMGIRKCYANNATNFAANSTNNYWTRKFKRVLIVGGHSFYSFNKDHTNVIDSKEMGRTPTLYQQWVYIPDFKRSFWGML